MQKFETLLKVKEYLEKNPVTLSNMHSDGRVNSSVNEEEIIRHLNKEFEIEEPGARSWYDMAIDNEEKETLFVNNIRYPLEFYCTIHLLAICRLICY